MSRSTYLEKEVIQEYISSAGSYDNTVSGLSSVSIKGAIDEIVSGSTVSSSAQDSTVNEETITTNKTLVPEDSIYQHILSNTVSLEVALPSSPVNGTHFIIKNDDAGSEDITITGGSVAAVLSPGKIYEVVYGSTKWMVI